MDRERHRPSPGSPPACATDSLCCGCLQGGSGSERVKLLVYYRMCYPSRRAWNNGVAFSWVCATCAFFFFLSLRFTVNDPPPPARARPRSRPNNRLVNFGRRSTPGVQEQSHPARCHSAGMVRQVRHVRGGGEGRDLYLADPTFRVWRRRQRRRWRWMLSIGRERKGRGRRPSRLLCSPSFSFPFRLLPCLGLPCRGGWRSESRQSKTGPREVPGEKKRS